MDLKFPEPVDFFVKTSGLNNKFDSVSISDDELVECIDFVIDELGLPETRDGYSIIVPGDFHSAPQEPDLPYIVENRVNDSALYFVNPDLSLKGLRNLTRGAKVSYAKHMDRVYYVNGVENGYLVNDTSYTWPNPVIQEDDYRIISAAPIGTHIAVYMGRMLIAKGNKLSISEYLDFDSYELHRNYYEFGSNILMVRPTEGGVYVSDESQVVFMSGTIPGEAKFKVVSTKPAIEWSDIGELIQSDDLSLSTPELSAIWCGSEGVYLGLSSGQVVPLNKHKVQYPAAVKSGASILDGRTFIHSF